MALDGIFIKKLTAELQSAINTHIDKIHQPTPDELVLLLRKPGFAKKLYISARQGSQRVNFTEKQFDNPSVPPMFCMLLRKYVGSGRIISINQPYFERLIEITFSSLNEMGDIITPRLIIELISSAPNIILVNSNGKIIDALKRSSLELGGRIIQPGATYKYPEKQNKILPLRENLPEILAAVPNNSERDLLNCVAGLSPLVCREISYGYKTVSDIINICDSNCTPFIIKDNSDTPIDFSYIEIKQYSMYNSVAVSSFSELLELFYGERDRKNHLKQRSQDLSRLLNNLNHRISKRMNLRKLDLIKCESSDNLRVYGELLKANLYSVKSGTESVKVPNYYDENLTPVTIPLDVTLSPQANAAKYFKAYKKSCTAKQTLTLLIAEDEKELKYLESVDFALASAKTAQDIEEIREELISYGYIRRPKNTKPKKSGNSFNETVSPSGWRVVIGKNNRQNDMLTCNIAGKGDMWFHTKNIPGSHVIVFCNGNELTQKDIIFAATLAAENSKASGSAQIPVDYTRIKHVKKPNGAKAGMVIYTENKTVFVTPKEKNND